MYTVTHMFKGTIIQLFASCHLSLLQEANDRAPVA